MIRLGIVRMPRRSMQVLENEIIPEFYKRDEQGIPRGWVAKIRESMAVLTPEFSANRTVRQYTEEHYIPAATAYARRACGDSELTTAFLTWQEEIARALERCSFRRADGD